MTATKAEQRQSIRDKQRAATGALTVAMQEVFDRRAEPLATADCVDIVERALARQGFDVANVRDIRDGA